MTIEEAKRKLRAHLDKRGFTDIEVNVTGGYDPTETDENSKLIQAQTATYKGLGIVLSINPRMAGSGRVCASPDRRSIYRRAVSARATARGRMRRTNSS